MPFFRRNRDAPNGSNNTTNHASSPADFDRQAETLIPAEVRMISGCHSEQTSADIGNVGAVAQLPDPAGRAGGACTSALLDILYKKRNQKLTFQQVLLDLRKCLQNSGFDQIPQLTSSRPLDVQDTPFSLVGGPGERRALLVGINYRGQNGELSGCHNDVFNVKKYIMEAFGYQEHNILILVDDGRHHYPNRSAIITALKQLVVQSQPGDSVYFHYSGHGGLLNPDWNPFKNNNKDYDETIYPLDHERNGHIRDFSLFNHFVKPMVRGVTVTCVIDACHSGAVLELPYSYRPSDAGMIRTQRNMSSLSNLAFLYLLAGGMLPPGFDSIAGNIEDVTGGNLDDYQGMGMDDAAQDLSGYYVPEETPAYGDTADFQDAGDFGDAADTAPSFAADGPGQGFDMPEGGPRGIGVDDVGPLGGPPAGLPDGPVQGNDLGNNGPGFLGGDDIGPAGFAPPDPNLSAYGGDGGQGWDGGGGFASPDPNLSAYGGDGGQVWDEGDTAGPTSAWDGDAGGWGDSSGWDAGDAGGDVPEMDCGCLADVLGALLEE